MNGPVDNGVPTNTDDDVGNAGGSTAQVLGIYFFFLFIVLILSYMSYICNRNRNMRHLPPIPLAGGGVDYHYTRLPVEGLGDDVLETFPTILYSETEHGSSHYTSGCSICLTDYKATDMVRLLPECAHLFHVSCIDTWLKVHRTCPVCRNSLDLTDSLKYISVS